MPKANVYNMAGQQVGEVELSEGVFGVEPNEPAVHAVVVNHLANCRQGTQSARTRTEVRGGGKKIYRQKGTGNARHHGRRAPQFTHGGVVFAPKPRDYRINVPKKVRRLAMKSALTSKVNDSEIVVVDKIELTEAKTRNIVAMLKALGADKKALIVTADNNEMVVRASNNIQGVSTAFVGSMNVVDILNCDKFIISQDAVKRVEEVYAE